MFCNKASAMPFCQHLSRDCRYQALSCFFPANKKAKRGVGMRLYSSIVANHIIHSLLQPHVMTYEAQLYCYLYHAIPGVRHT